MQDGQRIIVVSNAYPRPGDLYRYEFLHARVQAYLGLGLPCDVFVVDTSASREGVSSYEFEGVAVLTGSPQAFDAHLEHHAYAKLVVHFPMPYMLDSIDRHSSHTPTALWLHGYETEAWWRRWFNHLDDDRLPSSTMRRHRDAADARLTRLSAFLDSHPDTVVVTVSDWFRKHCIEPDLGRALHHSAVIPNYIDGDLFHPDEPVTSAQRRVLVLRPFTSAKYAGSDIIDTILTVTAATPSVEFTVCGDGPQFDAAVEPLSHLANVAIHRGFMSRSEVADLHRRHGIFLNPTWWDSQGVSTCEAMASGLAVVSTNIAAVPEFVEHEVSGLLAAPGDVEELADAVKRLAQDDELRQRIARTGREKIVEQCGFAATIREEVELILGRRATKTSSPIDWKARYAELAEEFSEVLCRLGAREA